MCQYLRKIYNIYQNRYACCVSDARDSVNEWLSEGQKGSKEELLSFIKPDFNMR